VRHNTVKNYILNSVQSNPPQDNVTNCEKSTQNVNTWQD